MDGDDDAPPGVPEWVVTYGDMMSLLLTFFIMLVSMSKLKEEGRVRMTLNAMKEVFGPDEVFASGTPGTTQPRPSAHGELYSAGSRSRSTTGRGSKDVAGRGGPNNPVDRIREGKQITIGGPAMFARFSADVGPELKEVLDTLVNVAHNSTKLLAIRGHASPEPLPAGAAYEDHHALAFGRAEKVAAYLVSKGVDPRRVVTSSAGASEPRIRTRDPEKQRMNDRVDVFLVDAYTTTVN